MTLHARTRYDMNPSQFTVLILALGVNTADNYLDSLQKHPIPKEYLGEG